MDPNAAKEPPTDLHLPPPDLDIETQEKFQGNKKHSVYKSLGWLDRLLVLWILLAIIIGILLGNFVDSVGPALQKGKFVNVSVPIGMCSSRNARLSLMPRSYWAPHHDVSNPVQGEI